MSSRMNRTQAEEYAKTMTYKQAISNIRTGKGIVYRKATMIKLNELAEIADRLVMCKDCEYAVGPSFDGYLHCDVLKILIYETGYCSYGVRR